jgi:hypothetical protein
MTGADREQAEAEAAVEMMLGALGGGGTRGPSQATLLLAIAKEMGLWHAPDGEPYADCRVGDHRETYALRSRAAREYLRRAYYRTHRGSVRGESLAEAIDTLCARARYEGEERPVWLRVAEQDGAIYLDLADADWRAIKIDVRGWRIVANPPVRFRRAPGMLALPVPVEKGTLAPLRKLVRVEREEDWLQIVGWLLAALRPRGPYPVLALAGEPGASKSTTARILRSLVDPSVAALRAEPREHRDLIVAARAGWVIALDNLSRIAPWLSDALCRLATGGGYSARELYSDLEEVVIDLQRPVVVTAIEEVCTRGDLSDRALAVTLPSIPDSDRRSEREIVATVEGMRPIVLGALLDIVACGLRELPHVSLDTLPRLADYGEWLCACEPALGLECGLMLRAYSSARDDAASAALESSAVATALRAWLAGRETGWTWQGSATELLEQVAANAAEEVRRDPRRWPRSGRGLAGALLRLAPALRRTGIDLGRGKTAGSGSRRFLTVAIVATVAAPAREGTKGDGSDVPGAGRSDQPSHQKAAPGANCDGSDGRDDRSPTTVGRVSV